MSAPGRLALIGERDPARVPAHRGIETSVVLYRSATGRELSYDWVPTSAIAGSIPEVVRNATGIWCTPNSPYANTAGALRAIQFARTKRIPFLGTCGGFQHALMEFAEGVLDHDAAHQETEPNATNPLISQLSCSLHGATGEVIATDAELFASILGSVESTEEFGCNFGLNMNLARIFDGSDLKLVAHDGAGQARAFRLINHPFFVGTLFQPERAALRGELHPVVRAFCDASAAT